MKKIGGIIVVLILILLFLYRDLVIYGVRQGTGQMKVILNAVPIDQYLLDEQNIPDSIRTKLLLIEEVKNYAVNELGINPSENYSTIYDQKGKAILWNVSASHPFALEPHEWSFPLLGSFSYKGYFNYQLALEEEDKLREMGLDTRVREVGGWSTLGWFKDPILSNMLSYRTGELCELIIHELTHGTLYVKDSVDFNENLATFIGRKGAEMFLIDKYGPDSFELKEYLNRESDYEKYIAHMLRGAESLDSLYSSFSEDLVIEKKRELKSAKINEIISGLDTINFMDTVRFNNRFKELPNNAYFMAVLRYRSKTDYFENELNESFNGDLKSYMNFLKEKYPSL